MSFLEWKPEYEVGVDSIDWEHRQLFGMISELQAAIEAGRGTQAGMVTLAGMVAYTREHFVNEENLMFQMDYPGFARHKLEHERLAARAFSIIDEFGEGDAAPALKLLGFLKEWWQLHILACDKGYVAYMGRRREASFGS